MTDLPRRAREALGRGLRQVYTVAQGALEHADLPTTQPPQPAEAEFDREMRARLAEIEAAHQEPKP